MAGRLFVCLAVLLGAVGCAATEPPPDVLVAVLIDEEVPVHTVVVRTFDPGQVEIESRELEGPQVRRAFSFALSQRTPGQPIHVEVEALDQARESLVVRSARFVVPTGDALHTATLTLDACCVGHDRCPGGQTCIGGVCTSDVLSPDALVSLPPLAEIRQDAGVRCPPSGDGGVRDAATPIDASQLRDSAIVDAQLVDAQSVDAQTGEDAGCRAGCGCAQTCRSGCSCANGCSCDLDCDGATSCQNVSCTGAGTSCSISSDGATVFGATCAQGAQCTIDARGSTNANAIECTEGASCAVDCRNTTTCRLRCETGAECLLQCTAVNGTCQLDCHGAPVNCGGGLRACGRACP